MSLASLLASPARGFGENHSSGLALWAGIGFFAAYGLAAAMGQTQMLMMIVLGILLCGSVVCLRLPVLCCIAWLLVVGTTPEIWVANIVSGSANTVTAAVKVCGLGLVAICALRYGLVFDLFNPGFAFVLMFFVGLEHGLYPTLSIGESLRTLIGSAAPYAFSFCRLPRRWCAAMIETVIWIPSLILVFGVPLAAAHVQSLLAPDEGGSVRLAGSTIPAFLATLAMTSIYACLVELYRDGRSRYLWLFALNFVILVGSGSRMPLACAVVVTGIAFIAIRSESFTLRKRVLPFLVGLFVLPVLLVLAATSKSLRLLTLLSSNSNATDLSGRGLIWPFFESAWDKSPIFGWGVGTGKILVDPDSLTAKLLGTTAAHNEYLRIGVEGGYVGIALVMIFMVLWTWRWSTILTRTDKIITRLVMVGFAVESITDNTLIAAPTSVLFVWISAVFARGSAEAGSRDAGTESNELAAVLDRPSLAA